MLPIVLPVYSYPEPLIESTISSDLHEPAALGRRVEAVDVPLLRRHAAAVGRNKPTLAGALTVGDSATMS
jgi:hypothetical protein